MGPAIYLSAGPSGAGKDTLLLGAREALAAARDNSVLFIRRHLTREATKVTEIEVSVTAEEFRAAATAGKYALEWSAHGTRYAITKADLEYGIAAGKRMVLNTSRSVIDDVVREYGNQRGIEVYCLLITASKETLRARLLGRGREDENEVRPSYHHLAAIARIETAIVAPWCLCRSKHGLSAVWPCNRTGTMCSQWSTMVASRQALLASCARCDTAAPSPFLPTPEPEADWACVVEGAHGTSADSQL